MTTEAGNTIGASEAIPEFINPGGNLMDSRSPLLYWSEHVPVIVIVSANIPAVEAAYAILESVKTTLAATGLIMTGVSDTTTTSTTTAIDDPGRDRRISCIHLSPTTPSQSELVHARRMKRLDVCTTKLARRTETKERSRK